MKQPVITTVSTSKVSSGIASPPAQYRRPSLRLSDLWKSPLHALPVRDELLFQYLPLSPSMAALECGPGTGFTAFRLSRLVSHITLLDIAPGNLARLKETLAGVDNLDFVCADITLSNVSKPVKRGYDVIYGLDMFEYVVNPAEWLGNVSEMLKPGGVLFMTWPNYNSRGANGTNYIPTVEAMSAMLRDAKLERWEVYTVSLRPFAQIAFEWLHEKPMKRFRQLRGHPDHRSAPTFDLTWTCKHGARFDRYRHVIHLYWAFVIAALRLGGDCFSRTRITQGSADGNLLLIAQR